MGPLWALASLPGAALLFLPAELLQLKGHCHLWMGGEVGSGMKEKAPRSGGGAL